MDGGNWKEMFNAACAGDLELVQYHVKRGVDVNYAHPEFLSTPLVACTLAGHEDMALYLLDVGADPGLRSEFDALTPMEAAQLANFSALVARLEQLGVSAEVRPPDKACRSWFGRMFGRHVA